MRVCIVAGVVLLLASAASAQERDVPPAVIDDAKLFSPAAVARVEEVAKDLRENFDLDLCVMTVKEPAAEFAEKIRATKKSRETTALLRKAAQDAAWDKKVRGVFALVTLEPKEVTVVGWPGNLENDWRVKSYKRAELAKALRSLRLDKDAQADRDRALVAAAEGYRNLLGDPQRRSPVTTLLALAVAGSVFGFWLVVGFLRRRVAGPGGAPAIYRPAMLGSMFGVPAGFWIHDRLFQAERPAPAAAGEPPAGYTPPVDETPV